MDGETNQYAVAAMFLRAVDSDWNRLVEFVGPCTHDPKAEREPYEALIRAIAFQQLTAKAGDAIIGRLKALYFSATFPLAEDIVAADFDALRSCGFSTTKVATVKAIAKASMSGLVPSRVQASVLSDGELIERITAIKGIGRWTVEMLLMYTMQRDDVLPADDFGIREGYRILKQLSDKPKPKALRDISLAWSPHRTVASWYLWRAPRGKATKSK